MQQNVVIRPVRAGEEIVVEVEGGYVRQAAPSDGLAVETASGDLFLPADVVASALRMLPTRPQSHR